MLSVRRVSAGVEKGLPIVLIHGWGIGSKIWLQSLDLLRQEHEIYLLDMPGYQYDGDGIDFALEKLQLGSESIESLSQWSCELPSKYLLIGFSLGGIVASLGLRNCFSNAVGVITVATNIRFVANAQWPTAMQPETFAGFKSDFQTDPAKTLNRFCHLQTKSSPQYRLESKQLLSMIDASPLVPSNKALQFGLDCLEYADLEQCWSSLDRPVMHHFGRHDALVPVEASNALCERNSSSVKVFEQSAHLPFISETAAWGAAILDFLASC